MIRACSVSLLVSSLVVACSGGGGGGKDSAGTDGTDGTSGTASGTDTAGMVTLEGGVQKGPFVLGSSLEIAPVDANGNPSGESFPTQTKNDLGEFDVTFAYSGVVTISAVGFYYNEVTGQLSDANLTLRAFAEVGPGAQPVYVNLVTHLTHARVEELMGGGATFSAARTQAESELRAALGVGPSTFDPATDGVDMNVLGGDDDANAYLFAVSAVLSQAAVTRAGADGSVDANLQEILNAVSLDLAEDGMLLPTMFDELQQAEMDVDPVAVEEDLAARLVMLGSGATVPDIDRVLDSDNDDVPNLTDNCPRIPNPTQAPVAGLCNWTEQTLSDPGLVMVRNGTIGDFDGDGNGDVQTFVFGMDMMAGGHPRLVGDGAGGGTFAAVTMPMDFDPDVGGDQRDARTADMNGDGTPDVVVGAMGWNVFHGQGSGFDQNPVPVEPGGAFTAMVEVADFNDDGRMDAAGVINGQKGVGVALGNAMGTRDPQVASGFGATGLITILAVGDMDGDGNMDVISGEADPGDATGTVTVLSGDGAGGLSAGATAAASPGFPTDMATGDYDGDGDLDVSAIVVDINADARSLTVWHGDGAGALGAQVVVPLDGVAVDHAALRAADGTAAIVVAECNPSVRQVFYRSDGTDILEGPTLTLSGCQPRAGDLNGDGQEDLALIPVEGGASPDGELSTVLVNP